MKYRTTIKAKTMPHNLQQFNYLQFKTVIFSICNSCQKKRYKFCSRKKSAYVISAW